MTGIACDACEMLESEGYAPTLVNVRFVKPLDTALLDLLARDHRLFVTIEENVKNGGFGEHVSAYLQACHPDVKSVNLAIWDRFIEQGSVSSLRAKVGLTAADIVRAVEEHED